MPTHALVPFDGSPLAEQALEHACETFETSTITVLYVIDSHSDETAHSGWGDHPGEFEEWVDERRAYAEELFVGAQDVADEYGVSLQTGVAVGRTAEMVLEAAAEYGADHIVVGTHGRSQLKELFLGSVAEELVRTSPFPVTTVR